MKRPLSGNAALCLIILFVSGVFATRLLGYLADLTPFKNQVMLALFVIACYSYLMYSIRHTVHRKTYWIQRRQLRPEQDEQPIADHVWWDVFSTMPLTSTGLLIWVKFARLGSLFPEADWMTDISILLVINGVAITWIVRQVNEQTSMHDTGNPTS